MAYCLTKRKRDIKNMLKTVFFDLDDTLLDFKKAEDHAIRETFRALSLDPSDENAARYSQINGAHWKMLERGEITRKELLTHRFEILFDELHVVRSSNDAQKIYETALSNGAFTMPNAIETLTALYPHYALYLVTNGADKVQSRRIQLADMGKFFKNVFVSERFGVNKPRIEFFDKCFAQISDFKKEEAVIIGDSLTSDIKGGNIADIRTIWYNPLHKTNDIGVTVHHEIADLCELPPLLSSLSENFQDIGLTISPNRYIIRIDQ